MSSFQKTAYTQEQKSEYKKKTLEENRQKFPELFKYYVDTKSDESEKNNITVLNYSKLGGSFTVPISMLPIICVENLYIHNFALVEVKTPYYKFMVDIDYKPDRLKELNASHILNKSIEITDFIIKNLIVVLNETFVDPIVSYIYLDKGEGFYGQHLHFPYITVNKMIHSYICKKLYSKCIKMKLSDSDEIWDKIIDKSVANANGLRLPYFVFNGNYYRPNWNKSTHKEITKRNKLVEKCLIRTNEIELNYELQDSVFEDVNEVANDKRQTKQIIYVTNVINKDHSNNQFISFKDDKEENLFSDLLNILSIKRLDSNDTWFNIPLLCRSYNQLSLAIKICKKFSKYDNSAEKRIRGLWSNKYILDNCLKIGSLIKWAKDDNFFETYNILRKYDPTYKCDLQINNLDDFYNYGFNVSYDYVESTEHVSRKAKKHIFKSLISGTRVLLVGGPTGIGKTRLVRETISFLEKKVYDRLNINEIGLLSIVSRISMISTHKKAFGQMLSTSNLASLGEELKDEKDILITSYKFNSYLDTNCSKDVYIRSLENLKNYDKDQDHRIVICDEINSLIDHFYSSTMDGKRNKCFLNFCRIISSASYVIMCDANITGKVLSFLKIHTSLGKKVYYYKNYCPNKKGKMLNIYSLPCPPKKSKINDITEYEYEYEFNQQILKEINKQDAEYDYLDDCDLDDYIEYPFLFNDEYDEDSECSVNSDEEVYNDKEDDKKSDEPPLTYSEVATIKEFINIAKDDFVKKKSTLIFTDSLKVAKIVVRIITSYGIPIKYLLISKDSQLSDIDNCNTTFVETIVISSPKIVYGLDILIHYDNIYCIYKFTSHQGFMDSLQYYQQCSRARNCEVVNILILDQYYDKRYNTFISFEENKQKEMNQHDFYIKGSNSSVINELCSNITINGVEMNNNSLFSEIHYYTTWYNRIFNSHKMQLVKKIAENVGYTINEIKLIVKTDGHVVTPNGSKVLLKDKQLVTFISEKVLKGDKLDDNEKKIGDVVSVQPSAKINYLKNQGYDIETSIEAGEHIDLVSNDKIFNTFISRKYLDLSNKEFDEVSAKIISNEIPILAKNNSLINKIKAIQIVENIVGIKRYQINDIGEIDVVKIKAKLNEFKWNIIVLFDCGTGKKTLISNLTKKIEKLDSVNSIQKFVADCYNSFGNIIDYKSKREYDKEANKRSPTCYHDFSLVGLVNIPLIKKSNVPNYFMF
jgi:hypothetical protein